MILLVLLLTLLVLLALLILLVLLVLLILLILLITAVLVTRFLRHGFSPFAMDCGIATEGSMHRCAPSHAR